MLVIWKINIIQLVEVGAMNLAKARRKRRASQKREESKRWNGG